jgi:hypothetical protein
MCIRSVPSLPIFFGVPESKFTHTIGLEDGKEYLEAEILLHTTFLNGVIEWSCMFEGEVYGTVTVN